MIDLRRARTRMLSMRSLIAIGGVAAVGLGLTQVTGTMAANPTDAVSATAQVATGNFFPTPVTSAVTCSDNGLSGTKTVTVSWNAAPDATAYRVKIVNDSNENDVLYNEVYAANDRSRSKFRIKSYTGAYMRIYTINNGVESSGWRATGVQSASGVNTWCTQNPEYSANQGWENTKVWDPTTPAPNTQQRPASAPEQRMALKSDVTEQDVADETTTEAPTPETAAASASTSAAPTTTSPSQTTTSPSQTTTSPPTTLTQTEDPKLVLKDTVKSGELTAGWTTGGNKVAVVDGEGNELASGRAERGSALHWLNGQLWIVGETEVYRIMESPQDGKWKFYQDSGQNTPDFG